MRRILGCLFVVSMLSGTSLAVAETLSELPFSKKLKLAEVGDEEAQMVVASTYEQGSKEAKKSLVEAARWYREAALKGNVEAEFRLARLVS